MLFKLALATFIIALPLGAHAEEQPAFEALPSVSDTSFENPDEALGKAEEITMPLCDDAKLYQKILGEVRAFLTSDGEISVMAKRRNALIGANIEGFEEIPVANFSPETDNNTANALITLKINQKVREEDIRLCRQKGEGNLYVILYPYQDNVKGHIINLNRYDTTNEGVSFIYP